MSATVSEPSPIYAFLTADVPNDTFTQLLGINDFNTIAGYHNQAVNQGFTLTLPANFTPENFPGSASTQVVGINNFGTTDGFYVDQGGTTHGFIDAKGSFTSIDAPNTAFNQLLGINDKGQEAGYSSTDPAGAVNQLAYVRQPDGTFTYLKLPTNVNSQATGINDHGVTVGFFQPTSTTSDGFILRGHHLKTLQVPGSTFTQALGINNEKDVVGVFQDANANSHGFIYDDGKFSTVDVPGATQTTINGINDFGNIVGFDLNANGNTDGFVGSPLHGLSPTAVWSDLLPSVSSGGSSSLTAHGSPVSGSAIHPNVTTSSLHELSFFLHNG